jgi:hypothetical protein
MARLRWSRFFWADWASDAALRLCPVSARGVWMELLCIAAQSREYGYVLVAGRIPTEKELARLCGCQTREFRRALACLERHGVVRRRTDGCLFSGRLVADLSQFLERQQDGRKGGNPALKASSNREEVNPQDSLGLTYKNQKKNQKKKTHPRKPPPGGERGRGNGNGGVEEAKCGFVTSAAADMQEIPDNAEASDARGASVVSIAGRAHRHKHN